jgi:uncharacterized membrane protein
VLLLVALSLGLSAPDKAAQQSALVLFAFGSFFAFFAQVFADLSGAFSRAGLLNGITYLYSLVWLPAIALFILSRLWLGKLNEAGSTFIVFFIFLLISFSSRAQRLQREQTPQAA